MSRTGRRGVEALALAAAVVSTAVPAVQSLAPDIPWRVVASHPHDPEAFTQGLVLVDGRLYESTGMWGQSSLREVELATGRVLRSHRLSDKLFAEGLAVVDERLVQLTWRAGVAFVYARSTFEPLERFDYEGEGWGLAHDGERLVMSDGSDVLRLLDPATFRPVGELAVRDGGSPVAHLNELEFAGGCLYANVWRSTRIARISPGTGRVNGWLDLTRLARGAPGLADRGVLNGIAHDPEAGTLLVTGKRWRTLFVVAPDPPGPRCGSSPGSG